MLVSWLNAGGDCASAAAGRMTAPDTSAAKAMRVTATVRTVRLDSACLTNETMSAVLTMVCKKTPDWSVLRDVRLVSWLLRALPRPHNGGAASIEAAPPLCECQARSILR